MHNLVKVTDSVYWVGANDRKTERFENYMPLPMGVAYNSYVIKDEKTCVIDTVEFGVEGLFMEKLECVLDGKDLDYIVVNHMEPDHSGGLRDLMKKYPNAKVVGNAKTFPMMKAFIHEANEENFHIVKEGDVLDLGHHKLTFAMMPMVHWPESMVTYDTTEKILFSNDAFGSFGALDGGIFDDEVNFDFYEDEMRRYYANIVGKYGMQVQNAIKKLSPLEIKYICPSHGIVWRTDIKRVIKHYDYWSRLEPESEGVVIVYGTMYGNTAKQANAIARELSAQGIKEVKVYDASKTDHSFILSDIWKYKGLIIGSCSHNNALYPKVQPLLHKLQNYGLKNRYLGIFGNMMWSGGGVRGIQAFADALNGNEIVAEAVEVRGNPTLEDYEKLENIARAMAEKIKSHR
ncbi:FprA family A-type flavoprotein [Ilyobacter polytropus]|uniref:Flavodoxin/nitric oxide synthase n=1 Tax=Ilyobacter polytropus (strain ATCC 51220 / DSM 2926 / LMG 16218 / CuHBu1) TaxID=572544 RepID=E3H7Z7_ILYPC|nr:FprA family A-type flavoprotein [Ilyobacter polytropus]ADO82949.1 flavodoxin/nitric oxide synthase [Ilyobacter polytropus DSM 2926]